MPYDISFNLATEKKKSSHQRHTEWDIEREALENDCNTWQKH